MAETLNAIVVPFPTNCYVQRSNDLAEIDSTLSLFITHRVNNDSEAKSNRRCLGFADQTAAAAAGILKIVDEL